MKFNSEYAIILFISWYGCTRGQTSAFDVFVPKLRLSTDALLKFLGPSSQNLQNLQLAEKLHKLQPRINDDVPFPCPLNNTRSEERPTSVHALRPGDIDVIGAIGDSLLAGNGIAATHVFHIAIQNRGISPAAGGQGTWRQYVTLPNILKVFNPQLIGYALADSFINHNVSQFNVAEAFAVSRDTPFMAKELIKRIRNDPKVNIQTDWKVITILIGANDFCAEICYQKNPENALDAHRRDLTKVLRILRENLPRTIVNLILAPHLKIVSSTTVENRPDVCYFTRNFLCPCIFGLQYRGQQDRFNQIMSKWQEVQIDVGNNSEFDGDDFTVVAQPFILNYNLAKTTNGLTDYSVLSQDCFHPSQKESARAAISIWNNMLEPVGEKSTAPSELFNFKCPTMRQPYIFTRRNSVRYI